MYAVRPGRTITGMSTSKLSATAVAGCVAWAALFGLVHVYWLFGGRFGLPAELHITGVLLIIDAVAVPLCFGAAAIALALYRSWGPRRAVLVLAWLPSAIGLIHAAPTLPDWVELALGRHAPMPDLQRFDVLLYEPWFLAGGVVFGLLCLSARRGRYGLARSAARPIRLDA
jgi:hypothetical protein